MKTNKIWAKAEEKAREYAESHNLNVSEQIEMVRILGPVSYIRYIQGTAKEWIDFFPVSAT